MVRGLLGMLRRRVLPFGGVRGAFHFAEGDILHSSLFTLHFAEGDIFHFSLFTFHFAEGDILHSSFFILNFTGRQQILHSSFFILHFFFVPLSPI